MGLELGEAHAATLASARVAQSHEAWQLLEKLDHRLLCETLLGVAHQAQGVAGFSSASTGTSSSGSRSSAIIRRCALSSLSGGEAGGRRLPEALSRRRSSFAIVSLRHNAQLKS